MNTATLNLYISSSVCTSRSSNSLKCHMLVPPGGNVLPKYYHKNTRHTDVPGSCQKKSFHIHFSYSSWTYPCLKLQVYCILRRGLTISSYSCFQEWRCSAHGGFYVYPLRSSP